MVRRIFIEKKDGFDVSAKAALADFRDTLGKKDLKNVRVLNRYDIEGLEGEEFAAAVGGVFSEPAADIIYYDNFEADKADTGFAVEYLPGQYDQRADSAAECALLLLPSLKSRPSVKCATVYVLTGVSGEDAEDIKAYVINPVDSREASERLPETLKDVSPEPSEVGILTGFNGYDSEELKSFIRSYGLAMSLEDLKFVQQYFRDDEKRDPTIAEIRVIDTYWSDHCRHTTFLTKLESVKFDDSAKDAESVYKEYLKARKELYGDKKKDICLMDIATLYVKQAKKAGLPGLDDSDEINACSIRESVIVDGKPKDYLIMFKNETHNHPTEIEPFGGAATCLGGAIRDPLSGRSYVYHAMRITGSGDPRESVKDTLPGKLPQRKLCKESAHGYSSYGNQIGLATGLVDEIYHEGYKAKRMELGAVIGAAPAENVIRKRPQPGDIILLLGGATGRDGCGGATGSSKAHDVQSIGTCGAEVQKGNPLIERKLQRLFRNKEFSALVKRCNDFGAGGVCVAIGELAGGVCVDLDKVRKKYEGLGGVELAISESQERMAIVIAPEDADKVLELAKRENLHADKVAEVTDRESMELFWRGKPIVNIKRSFLDTNGATAAANALVAGHETKDLLKEYFSGNFRDRLLSIMSDINICSKKGLIEMFDSTIGAGTINMPLGGRYQLTPVQAMAAKAAAEGECKTATVFSYGFDPYLMEKNPFIGAIYSVVLSLAKLAAAGADISRAWLTMQEYFERMIHDTSWGKPLSALLGAWWAQKNLGTPAIGGKDSMSGTFEDIHVPSTLVSFALSTEHVDNLISPEFKHDGSTIYRVRVKRSENGVPDFESIKKAYASVHELIKNKKVFSAYAVERGGALAAIAKMALGNGIGASLSGSGLDSLTDKAYGDLILEGKGLPFEKLGVTGGSCISFGKDTLGLSEISESYIRPLIGVYPVDDPPKKSEAFLGTPDESCFVHIPDKLYEHKTVHTYSGTKIRPRIAIPVFPGTNCEYDSAAAFARAGGLPEIFVMRNIYEGDIVYSIDKLAQLITMSQILMLPGGFSAGDEPDGSGKFITAVLRAPKVKKAVEGLLKRDGLILGVCNGFQALIKVGLVPYGEIRDMKEDSPTLTFNAIGRHVSRLIRTRITSTASPWLALCKIGDIHTIAVSHGEGRFTASGAEAMALYERGRIATQYVDEYGLPTMEEGNPNGSLLAVEGLLSPDGRVFGKMGHSERFTRGTLKNVPGEKDQRVFESGVNYFL